MPSLAWLVAAGALLVCVTGCSGSADAGQRCLPSPLQLSSTTVAAGAQVTVSSEPMTCGASYPQGTTYTLSLKAGPTAPVQLTQVPVPADGAFSTTVTIPASTPAGEASIDVRGSLFDQPCQDGESSCAAYTTVLTVTA